MDQFFTMREQAEWVVMKASPFFPVGAHFLEPSAGDGVFLPLVHPIVAYDIEPLHPDVEQADFLTVDLGYDEKRVAIGNPPFGDRSELALRFVNKCVESCGVVAFILPPSFKKWGTQRHVSRHGRLVFEESVPTNSYRLPNGGLIHNHRRVLQVWSHEGIDLRMKHAPPTTHPDFQMWQFNCTPQALSVFDNDFDFAVPRQGYAGYERRETDANACEKSKQWMLIKANDPTTLDRLMKFDFGELALGNSATPGFGKADLVAAYVRSK
jgi:hypothetical protein